MIAQACIHVYTSSLALSDSVRSCGDGGDGSDDDDDDDDDVMI